jgi:hypothetical protein
VLHPDSVNEIGADQMMEELMDSTIPSEGAYSVGDRRLWAQPFDARGPHHRQDIGASLIVVLLLSLGLWVTIWGAVGSVSAVL